MRARCTVCVIAAIIVVLMSFAACVTTETKLSDDTNETWDYVILGSSIGTLWAEDYGALMESDLGVKIIYHNYYVGYQPVSGLLHNVINNERLREEIRNAEVITIGSGFADIYFETLRRYEIQGGYNFEQNGQKGLEEKIEVICKTYNSMLDEVLTLASPSDTIIRIMDFYFPYVGLHKEIGIYSTTRKYWMIFNECISQAGHRNGIPVANVFAAFNGSDGNDDPVDKGYIANDRLHPSELGMDVIATEFRKLGYQYTSR